MKTITVWATCLLVLISVFAVLWQKEDISTEKEKRESLLLKSEKISPPAPDSSPGRVELRQTHVEDVSSRYNFAYARSKVSPKVAYIIGLYNQHTSTANLHKEFRRLPKELSHDDVLALLDFLRQPYHETDVLYFNGLRNEVMNYFLTWKAVYPELGIVMTEMLLNPELDEGWRDYVAQFMPDVMDRFRLGRVYEVEGLDSAPIYDGLLDAWWQATDLRNGSIAGAALVGMSRYVEKDSVSLDRQAISDKAMELAADPYTSTLSRIHALQVAANLGDPRALPLARDVAKRGPTTLQRSAIAALGTLGGEKEADLLRQLAENPDTYSTLAPAIDSALARIAKRQS